MALLSQGPVAGLTVIQLSSLFGTFRIGKSRFNVRYASTFANPAQGMGHADLVKELKPMRDRVKASQLKDLGSLLQRDLSDNRVARDLIPYLLGESESSVGFFPAILAVMVPKGYLSGEDTPYPQAVPDPADPDRTKFGDCWAVSRFRMPSGEQLPLGLLEIMPTKADIIVLDGQHRANAFRYLSGDFDPNDDIHKMFYDGIVRPDVLDSDLPVTLIWFESVAGEPINPKLISRRLFVDVNNNAKHVSASRRILLDDRTVTCVGTQELYNHSAQNEFQPNVFSLLHGAFDADSDLAKGPPQKFVLTTPEIINEMLYWGLFGNETYDNLFQSRVGREAEQRNIVKFRRIFPQLNNVQTDNEENLERFRGLYFTSLEDATDFRQSFSTGYLPVLTPLFEQFSLLTPHYRACSAVADWITSVGDLHSRDVWRKVFCGGEGLYWSLDTATSNLAQDYLAAVRGIEERFSAERKDFFGAERSVVDGIYRSFVTKAFQVGYVAAVEYVVRHATDTDHTTAAQALVNRLNSFSLAQWVAVFEQLRPLIIGSGLDPRSWPTYRNLLIRMYDGDRGIEYGYDLRSLKCSPDWVAYEELLKRAVIAYAASQETVPDTQEVERQGRLAFDRVTSILDACGLKSDWFSDATTLARGIEFFKAGIDREYINPDGATVSQDNG